MIFSTMKPTDFMQWRYATKVFDATKRLSDSQLHELTEALRLSPSSLGLQPWKFLLVENSDLRASLREHSFGQAQVTDASHLFVLCSRDVNSELVEAHIEASAEARGVDVTELAGYRGMIDGFLANKTPEEIHAWSRDQVYLALGVLLASAASLEIDTCPMEGFSPEGYDELLGLSAQGLRVEVVCPVGFRSNEDKYATNPKARFAENEVITRIF